jgi:hypothetical protein
VTAAFECGRGNACYLCFLLQQRQKCLLSNHPAGYDECEYSKTIFRWALCRFFECRLWSGAFMCIQYHVQNRSGC